MDTSPPRILSRGADTIMYVEDLERDDKSKGFLGAEGSCNLRVTSADGIDVITAVNDVIILVRVI